MIDTLSYCLPSANYIAIENTKKRIVIANTFNHDMKHVIGWGYRFNGKYNKTAAFTIATDGTIYQHFDPKYHSEFFGNKDLDKKSIVILIENDGWLIKDYEKNLFYNWIGDIYKGPTNIVEKKWRGYNYWAPYNEKQVESAIALVQKLCEEFLIPMIPINHNTKVTDVSSYEGVLYRSNFENQYTDLSPSWDFVEFKNKVEEKIN